MFRGNPYSKLHIMGGFFWAVTHREIGNSWPSCLKFKVISTLPRTSATIFNGLNTGFTGSYRTYFCTLFYQQLCLKPGPNVRSCLYDMGFFHVKLSNRRQKAQTQKRTIPLLGHLTMANDRVSRYDEVYRNRFPSADLSGITSA